MGRRHNKFVIVNSNKSNALVKMTTPKESEMMGGDRMKDKVISEDNYKLTQIAQSKIFSILNSLSIILKDMFNAESIRFIFFSFTLIIR